MEEGNQITALNTLASLRTAVGVASWATPRLAGKLFGLDAKANPQSPYLARLFGVRDMMLAWGAMGSEGESHRQWLIAGMVCDVADAAAGVIAGKRGYLPKRASLMVSAAALAAAALGGRALQEHGQ